jgi:hypothetical protein
MKMTLPRFTRLSSKGWRLFCRYQRLKGIIHNDYVPDFSFETYVRSKFYGYSNNICVDCGEKLEIFEGVYVCKNCGYSRS